MNDNPNTQTSASQTARIKAALLRGEKLQMATFTHRLLKLGEIKKDKENTGKALDILKNLAK